MKTKSPVVQSGYLYRGFKRVEINHVIKTFKKVLKDNVFGDFDAIVCRGVSGLIMAPLLAYHGRKKLVITRKPDENSHSYTRIEGHLDIDTYIIVDDFVSSGMTIETIVDEISKHENFSRYNQSKKAPVLKGVFLWVGCEDKPRDKEKIAFWSNKERFNKIATVPYARVKTLEKGNKELVYQIDEYKFK
jgi:hypoxanthine phosphoribosyltransferase